VTAPSVFCGQPLAQCDADGTAGDVERARRKRVHEAVGAKDHLYIGGIVKEHGDDGVCAQFSLSWSGCGDCAFADQRFSAPFGAVPHA
jgi:hypothetical protein